MHNFDVLCLQETWLSGDTGETVNIPGYTLHEKRRATGSRGGIAILVRNSFPLLAEKGNEYAQQVQLGLPDGQKAVINNVYLPPYEALRRRNVNEVGAKEAVAAIV